MNKELEVRFIVKRTISKNDIGYLQLNFKWFKDIKDATKLTLDQLNKLIQNDFYIEVGTIEIIIVKQALSTPKITSEQVKEDILNLEEINKNLEEWEHIKQYISQLEGQNRQLRKGYEYMLELNLEFNSQLDAIREVENRLNKVMFESEAARALQYKKEVTAILEGDTQ